MISALVILLCTCTNKIPNTQTGSLRIEGSSQTGWVRTWGGQQDEIVNAVAFDNSGNVIVTGKFEDRADFEPGSGVCSLASNQEYGTAYVTKFDESGNHIWAFKLGAGENYVSPQDVVCDSDGSIVLTGSFTGSVDFDHGLKTARHNTDDDCIDAFTAKYSADSSLLWVRVIHGAVDSQQSSGLSAVIDIDDNVIVSGVFNGTVDLNPGSDQVFVTAACENYDMNCYMVKYDNLGEYIWAVNWEANVVEDVTIISNSAILVVGSLLPVKRSVDLDPGDGIVSWSSNDMKSLYITRYSQDGHFEWVKMLGPFWAIDLVRANSVSTDSQGNIFIAGSFTYEADFDPGSSEDFHSADEDAVNQDYLGDIFLTSLNSSGDYRWTVTYPGNSHATAFLPDLLPDMDYIYFAGFFRGSVDFNPGEENFLVTSNGGMDIFLCNLGSDGSLNWVQTWGGAMHDGRTRIDVDSEGNVVIGGYFNDSVDFNLVDTDNEIVSMGSSDCFIIKLDKVD